MKPQVEELVRKALELDGRDRAEVVDRLRRSLEDEDTEPVPRSKAPAPHQPKRFETKVFDLGPCQLENLDDVARALAIAEGEAFK